MKPRSYWWEKEQAVGPDSTDISECETAPWRVRNTEALCIAMGYRAASSSLRKPAVRSRA
jgi:hypothetical protein